MKKFYCENIIFDDSYMNLDNFSYFFFTGKGFYRPINSYYSFSWNNLILCLHDVHSLDICMKKFYCEKIIFDKMTAMRTWTIFLGSFSGKGFHGWINSYYSF